MEDWDWRDSLRRTREFLWEHRGKFLLTGAVAIIGGAYVWYSTPSSLEPPQEQLEYLDAEEEEEEDFGDRTQQKLALKQGVRSRLLLRVRFLFHFKTIFVIFLMLVVDC